MLRVNEFYGLWCQSANDISNVGTWYYDGAPVTTDDAASSLHAYNDATGQVGLLRDGGLSGIEGLYTCVILDEFNVSQTLAVALYRGASYDSNGKCILYIIICAKRVWVCTSHWRGKLKYSIMISLLSSWL